MLNLDDIRVAIARKELTHSYSYFEIDEILRQKIKNLDFEYVKNNVPESGIGESILVRLASDSNPTVIVTSAELATVRKKLAQFNPKRPPMVSVVKTAEGKFWIGHIVIYLEAAS